LFDWQKQGFDYVTTMANQGDEHNLLPITYRTDVGEGQQTTTVRHTAMSYN